MRLKTLGLFTLMLVIAPVLAVNSVDYIYIDASEGNASGGHVAIRFDDDVYHYQYIDPGLIKLEKQLVNDFEFNYRFLENRSLHLSQLAVSAQTYTLLRDHFDYRYQIQKQHYATSTELSREKMLLRYLSGQPVSSPKLLQIPGAGLFFSEQDFSDDSKLMHDKDDKHIDRAVLANVQQKIQARYGKQYIEQRIDTLAEGIKQMQPTSWKKQATQLQADQFSQITQTFTNRYLEAMTAWLALNVIHQRRPLRTEAYLTSESDEFVLSSDQRKAMKNFSVELHNNIIKLLQSSRPDWGYALLINLGRLLVLEQSIQQGRLVVLNNVDSTSIAQDIKQSGFKKELHSLYQDAINGLRRAKPQLVKQGRRQEQLYSQLEWQANRYLELDKVRSSDAAIPLYGVKRFPDKPLSLPKVLIPQLTDKQLKSELLSLQKVTENHQTELNKLYRYNLLQRNCVTELFKTIKQAVSKELASKVIAKSAEQSGRLHSSERLGGYISMNSVNFIPFMSHQAVQNQYRITEQRRLPSYRLQQLQNLYAQKNKLGVFFRESNTLSSTLYKANSADSFFVFFTDDYTLLRPLYGAVNTLAGLSQSVLGLFSVPFDSGQRLLSGARGLIMSLPELVFFNMRKGSFKYLPYSKMLEANETIFRKGNTPLFDPVSSNNNM